MKDGRGKSDSAVVAKRLVNKDGRPAVNQWSKGRASNIKDMAVAFRFWAKA